MKALKLADVAAFTKLSRGQRHMMPHSVAIQQTFPIEHLKKFEIFFFGATECTISLELRSARFLAVN